MRFLDQETGKAHDIFQTAELEADLKKHAEEFRCDHLEKELRRRTVAGGAIQICYQCLCCGVRLGNSIKREPSHNALKPFDESADPRFQESRETAYREICLRHLALEQAREASHQRAYDAYLSSEKWAEKRRKVLERAGGLCEGCRERRAEDVHHLTYRHIRDEFLFELVALCRLCHNRIHEDNEAILSESEVELPCFACRWRDEMQGHLWCGKFDASVFEAMAENGECGPDHREFEPLK